ncbi:MAG TPA: A/G-specific adenine glycosylase [Tepidisphaeraceae bacterium]|jgi:A/G-specific adenine glycosylase|nr:A/G-specific adenine glycosylase [Tepidisphaeraceae bacterium]
MIFNKRQFSRHLLKWFRQNRRDLPWRLPPASPPSARLEPYLVFVSEAMLQQTQVSTVVPYFKRFLQAFPTIHSLAAAEEQSVLRVWQGLGYYSRARNLHAAAKKIVAEFAGMIPNEADVLLQLPGVGRYTAGAIASIAYNRRAPILDGNVARVLARIFRIESDPREKRTAAKLWQLAEEILPKEGKPCGDFNSALMELGATVCTPRNPQCLICPVQQFCQAYAEGVQDRIPPPRKTKPTPLIQRWVFCIHNKNRFLIEQRPAKGRWAGMWQFVTIEPSATKPTRAIVKQSTGCSIQAIEKITAISHALTHRRYQFDVFVCEANGGMNIKSRSNRMWVRLSELDRYPLPKPHVQIAGILGDKSGAAVKVSH